MTELRPVGVAFSRPAQALWLAAALALTLVGALQPQPDWNLPVLAVGVLGPIHGAATFIRSGGERLTPSGLFSLTFGLLLGLGSYPIWLGETAGEFLATASVTAFVVQVLATPNRPSALAQLPRLELVPMAQRDKLLEHTGFATFGLALASTAVLGKGNVAGELLALAAIVVIAILYSLSRETLLLRLATPTLLVVVYAGLIHSGDGRLRLVGAACAVLFAAAIISHGRQLKKLVVASLPLGLITMAWLRIRHVESIREGLGEGRNGLESAIVPVGIYRDLLAARASGAIESAAGTSYLSVPSRLTGGTVPGLGHNAIGYELVAVHAPERFGSNFSVAGLAVAEWVFNFGLLTLPIFIVLLAWIMGKFDDALAATWGWLAVNRRPAAVLAAGVALTAFSGLADFAWGGSHTMLMRVFLRTLPLAFIAAVFGLMENYRAPSPPSRVPQRAHSQRVRS